MKQVSAEDMRASLSAGTESVASSNGHAGRAVAGSAAVRALA